MTRPRYDSGRGVCGRRPEFAFVGVVLAGRQVAGQHREHLPAAAPAAAEAPDRHLLLPALAPELVMMVYPPAAACRTLCRAECGDRQKILVVRKPQMRDDMHGFRPVLARTPLGGGGKPFTPGALSVALARALLPFLTKIAAQFADTTAHPAPAKD